MVAAILLLLLAGGAAFLYLSGEANDPSDAGDATSEGSPSPDVEEIDSALQDALEATEEAGTASIKTRLDAKMPASLDDGLPERRIRGKGVLASDMSLATVDYRMSKIPNSAGFFGHVKGALSAVYSEDRMLITFPLLEGVLAKQPDPGMWLSWDLSFLNTDYLMEIGVGQLRELALSDPRLGLALLRGVEEAEAPTETEIRGTAVTQYEVEAGTLEAGDAVSELDPVFTEMWEGLLLRRIPMTVSVDEEGRIHRLEYRMVYPAERAPVANDAQKVRLTVRHDLTEFGVEEEPELPPKGQVVTYEQYFLNKEE